jgi:hypothetical protein
VKSYTELNQRIAAKSGSNLQTAAIDDALTQITWMHRRLQLLEESLTKAQSALEKGERPSMGQIVSLSADVKSFHSTLEKCV